MNFEFCDRLYNLSGNLCIVLNNFVACLQRLIMYELRCEILPLALYNLAKVGNLSHWFCVVQFPPVEVLIPDKYTQKKRQDSLNLLLYSLPGEICLMILFNFSESIK